MASPLTSDKESLLACPFCGAGDPDIRAKTLEPAFSYVHCERCGAQGPCTSDEPHAEIAWNTRGGNTAVSHVVELRGHIEAQAIEITRFRRENDRLMQANRILQQRDDYVTSCLI